MQLKTLRLLTALGCFLLFSGRLKAQNCIPTNIDGATINLACGQNCTDLHFQIPHLKSTSDYTLVSIPYSPYPYSTVTGSESPIIYADDQFGDKVTLPFPFCFYDSIFNKLTVGSNGLITFDTTNANCSNAYTIPTTPGIPNSGGGAQCSQFATYYYPKAAIMAAYSDLDPRTPTASVADRKIQWEVTGTAPCRKFVISFYHVGVFGVSPAACPSPANTFQIVIHESTGIIEFFFEQKSCSSSTNNGRAIFGIQNWNRDKAITYAGRNPGTWSENNTGYRFIPSAGGSRYVISELYDLSNNLIAVADTITTTPGLLDLSFPNICPPGGSSQYVVKTTFSSCDNPANQLISYDNITISHVNSLNATSSATNTSCGPPSGTITVTIPVGAGTAPFTFQLDAGSPLTGTSPYTFNNVAQGPHTVIVTDALGCSSTLNVTVNLNNALTANTSTTAASCTGINNGTITITPTSGIAPYTYTLDGGTPVSGPSPYTFMNVSSGSHNVTATDANGCVTNVLSVNVGTGAGTNGTSSTVATTCTGVNNGSITINETSGTAPFTYQLDGGIPQNGTNPYTFPGVAAGSHTVVVTDNVGCTRTFTVNVTAGSGINGTASPTATSCPAVSDGTIIANGTTGTPPYTYQIDGGTFQSGANPYTFTGVAAGPHIVVIKDNFGCTKTVNLNLLAGPSLAANTNSAATTCSGATNGTITVTPTNGTAPYTFSLDGATPVSGTAPYTFSNVPAGPHNVVVTDASGCVTNNIPVAVITGPALTTSVNTTDALCNGGTTGIITVTVPTIGSAPYQYSLDGITWQSSNVFNGLPAGSYTVYYNESNGCQGSQPVTVSEPSALAASTSTVAAICNGQGNGIITINPSGGIAPYEYSIDGGANWQNNNVFTVPAGNYTIIIRDINNCTTTQTATVTEPATLTASSANSNATCDGGNDGVITVNAAGGNSGYQYSIDAGANWQVNNVFNVIPGNYTIDVKDNLGCTTTFNTTVGLTNNLTLTPQTDPTICEGTSTQLQLISNATDYSWTPRIGLNDSTIYNPVANPTTTTQYTVTATLGRCSATDIVIVNVNAAPIPDAGPPGDICYGQSYTLQGSGGVQYTWTPSTYLSNTSLPNPVSTPAKTITYTLSQVIDAIGCKSLVTDDVIVNVTPPIKVTTFPFDTIGYPGDQFQLNATSLANIYTWSPAYGISDPNIPNPVVTVGAIGNDVVYQVIASTAAGCKGEGYVRIKVYTGPDIYVPTGFSPNNDGKNDKFIPFPVGVKEIKYFRVFNRWGQMVFSTTRLNDGWDGKFGGADQASGVYVWMVQGITKDNRVITKKGTVMLIR